MRRIKAVLFLMLFVVISPALAFEDDMQNHPLNDISDVWTFTSTGIAGSATILNYPASYSQSNSVKLSALTGGGASSFAIKNTESVSSNYWSFVIRNFAKESPNNVAIHVKYYNSSGGSLGIFCLYGGQFVGSAGFSTCANINYLTETSGTLYELVTSGGHVELYRNGTDVGNIGSIAETPSYFEFYIGQNSGFTNTIIIDDVSTLGIVGANNQYTELNSDFQISYSTYAKYASPSSTYQQRVRSFATGSIINTTSISGYSGFVTYDRIGVFGTNYGYYQIYTTKDGILEASHNILYVPSVSLGSVSMDRDTYAIGDNIVATYSLITPDYGTYDYKAYLVRLSDFSTVATQSITSDSGTKTFDTSTYTADTYYVFLARTSGGTQQDFAYDFADLNDAVFINGVTYNAESGAALANVSVNDSQGATWFNDTSDGSGVYNLTGISVSVELNINASLTNYTHTNWSFTPLAGGTETVNLYLIPTAPTYTGTAILGLVGSYPWHQAISGATVNIWNASWSDSTTASATGYYIFNSLANDSTYSMNATMTGYTAASTTNVTVTNGSFVVQNFVLVPGYVLTVKAKDSVTGAFLSSFTTTISGTDTSTTNGSTTHSLDYGLYTITVSAADHYAASTNILLDEDQTATLELTPYVYSDAYPSWVYEKFIVRGLFDNPYPGLTLNVYNGSSSTVAFTGTTDYMGQVVFKLTKDTYYRGELSGTGITSMTFYFYGKEESYLITILSGFPTGGDRYTDILTNLTVQTFNATHSNLTIIYNDTRNTTSALNFYAKNLTTGTTCTQTSTLSVKQLNCTVLAKGTYQFGFNATSSVYGFFQEDKVINFGAGNTSSPLIPTTPPGATAGATATILHWGSIMLIVLTASLFSVKNLKLGAVIVPTVALITWAFGWLDADWKPLALAMVIGVIIYSRMSESKVSYQ